MKLVANKCANCRRVVGYVVLGTLELPTLCILCAGDSEILEEWGHKISKLEKPIGEVLIDYRDTLSRMNISIMPDAGAAPICDLEVRRRDAPKRA